MQHQSINNYFANYLSDIYGLTPKPPMQPEGLLLFPRPGNLADAMDATTEINSGLFKEGTRAFYFARGREEGSERANARSWGNLFPRFEEVEEGDQEDPPMAFQRSVVSE